MASCRVLPFVALGSAWLLSSPVLAEENTPVIPSTPEARAEQPTGGSLELAVFTGAGGLAGNVGVGLGYLPIPRLVLGAALGDHFYESADSTRQELRYAFFARGYFLDRPYLRLAIGLAVGTIAEDHAYAETDAGGQPVTVVRLWQAALRADGTLGIEVPLDNVALRLDAGLGRVFGAPDCWVLGAGGGPCQSGFGSDAMPSRWRPFVQLALAVRLGGGQPRR